jgi:hypothetical protein
MPANAIRNLLFVTVTTPSPVAYIDPSAGGALLQLLLGGTAGAAVLIRLWWLRSKAKLGLSDKQLKPPDQPPSA